jgi:D-alanyl-D-alanine carboxypeptidase (penicillin-binding protein 5/6)
MLWLYAGAVGTKTGTTARAGGCLVATARRDGRTLVAIVLDAPGEPFSSAATLLNYGFRGWERETVIAAGQSEGVVAIRGGSVPVVAGDELTALVPNDADIRIATLVDPRSAFPPPPGDQVGTVVARSREGVLGRVPLVVSDVPPAPASSGPWWVRTAVAVSGAVADAVHALAS